MPFDIATVLPIPVTALRIKSFWKHWFVNSTLRKYFLLKTMPNIIKAQRCGPGLTLIGKKLNRGFFLPIPPHLIRWNACGVILGARGPTIISSQLLMRLLVPLRLYSAAFNIIRIWCKITLRPISNCHKLCRMIYYSRGVAYNGLDNNKQAIKDFDKAIELDPNVAAFYRWRGIAYHYIGNHKQAIKDFDKAIELDPKDAVAYDKRGMAYVKLGMRQQAIQDFKIAARLGYKVAQDYLKSKGIRW